MKILGTVLAASSMLALIAPVFAAEPDGSLYVADSQKGRIWRVTYGNK